MLHLGTNRKPAKDIKLKSKHLFRCAAVAQMVTDATNRRVSGLQSTCLLTTTVVTMGMSTVYVTLSLWIKTSAKIHVM